MVKNRIKGVKDDDYLRLVLEASTDTITIVDMNGIVRDWNKGIEGIMGYGLNEVLEKSNRMFFKNPEDADRIMENALKKGRIKDYRTIVVKKNGQFVHLSISVALLKDEDGAPVGTVRVSRDITKEVKAKEMLVREIYHRVKNNLQVIVSLLSLQTKYIRDKDDLKIFRGTQNCVRAMALMHEKLHQLENHLTSVNLSEYVRDLAKQLFNNYNIAAIRLKQEIEDDIVLDSKTVAPCGLMINELISNSLEHAFLDGKKGEVKIAMRSVGKEIELIISDDGIGFPEDLDFRNTKSLGMQIVTALVRQLAGTIELSRVEGTTQFKVVFPSS